MQALKAGILYFACVFGAGFALGTARALWLVPRVGTRTAELMEMPFMLAVTNSQVASFKHGEIGEMERISRASSVVYNHGLNKTVKEFASNRCFGS